MVARAIGGNGVYGYPSIFVAVASGDDGIAVWMNRTAGVPNAQHSG